MKKYFLVILAIIFIVLPLPLNFLYAATSVKQGTQTVANKKVTLPTTESKKAEKERAKKVAESEKLFKNFTNYGIKKYILGIISDSLLNHDSTDITDTAQKLNKLSALINLSKNSKDKKLKKAAVSAEPIMIKYQKYFFPLLRKDYINDANKDRSLNDKFEYPNRCSNSDCEIFIKDSYCDADKTEDVQFLEDLKLYGWDAFELRFRVLQINYQILYSQGSCGDFSRGYKTNSPKDDSLMPTAYLGL